MLRNPQNLKFESHHISNIELPKISRVRQYKDRTSPSQNLVVIKTESKMNNKEQDLEEFVNFAQYFDVTPRAFVKVKNNENKLKYSHSELSVRISSS